MFNYDIAIASIPFIGYSSPPAAPAALKGHLLKHGFKTKTFDFNIEFKNIFKDRTDLSVLISYWCGRSILDSKLAKDYHQHLQKCAQQLAGSSAKWLGLSIFSRDSVSFAKDFLPYLQKEKSSVQKIIIGGYGLNSKAIKELVPYVDAYILGEGEQSLVELLKGNMHYPGINSPGIQIENLNELGYADYSDYNLDAGYDLWYGTSTLIPITGSRGCVRNCSFCDVGYIWEKFRYRSGHDIAKEIIHNYERTNHRHFYFTDSLINGNIRELMNMMRDLAFYRKTNNADITWGGQWIARKQKGLPKDYYELIAASGGFNLTIGVETGSDRVRQHMKKGFTTADLDDELEQFSKHGISCGFFIIVGYPTETDEDFNETLRMLKRYVKYVADGTLIGIATGGGFYPDVNAPLWKEGIIQLYDENSCSRWKSQHSNHLISIRRKLIILKVLNNLSYPSSNIDYELSPIIRESSEIFSESDRIFVEELLPNKNLDIDPEFLAPTLPEIIDLDLVLNSVAGESNANVTIQFNNKILFSGMLDEGQHQFSFKILDQRHRNILKIMLNNKLLNLNIKESHKEISLKEIVINGSRFLSDKIYMMGKVKSETVNGHGNGLYSNGCLRIFFKNPVHRYFIEKQNFFFNSSIEENKILIDKVSSLFKHFTR